MPGPRKWRVQLQVYSAIDWQPIANSTVTICQRTKHGACPSLALHGAREPVKRPLTRLSKFSCSPALRAPHRTGDTPDCRLVHFLDAEISGDHLRTGLSLTSSETCRSVFANAAMPVPCLLTCGSNMGTWKQRPRRFVEPPLVTHIECLGFSQNIAKERKVAKIESAAMTERLGQDAMTRPNRYFHYFRKDPGANVSNELRFTFDAVKDDSTYDPCTPRDTCHPMHTASARKACKVSLETRSQLRSSQAYGWLPPIDEPSYGYGRSAIFLDSSMDKSHLQTGGPWTAR